MIIFSNAKINLGLYIGERRADGYHDIETILCPIDLYDILEIVPAAKTTFTQSGILANCEISDNLVIKAYQLLKRYYTLPEVSIFLRKNIPVGSGLGGGSSNAAFMLCLLNKFADLHLSVEQLEIYAQQLGSDCSFFIRNEPLLAEGSGNIFTPIKLDLNEYYLILCTPNISVSTKEAYDNVSCQFHVKSLTDIINYPTSMWKNFLVNDFEEFVFFLHPEIQKIKHELYIKGAIYASISGSGSAVFGLFKKPYCSIWPFNFSVHDFI
ncbi:MAG: 4-(cytidine 5'-diphospho)-2-C-methyl-D-erythritol kinase [Bacteroidales bacterium OttesenSCG-928-I14]|jgi:4-diphosphocytidyl-2-C-methyl-D-erythritol kinase|nr:4-(cytidine 5'-diphospho)-2-C-methyl-D-erythritol kinase [Bacteroidales bacterium OttesenSCG-928-I14]